MSERGNSDELMFIRKKAASPREEESQENGTSRRAQGIGKFLHAGGYQDIQRRYTELIAVSRKTRAAGGCILNLPASSEFVHGEKPGGDRGRAEKDAAAYELTWGGNLP